jgi:hypothetical protein
MQNKSTSDLYRDKNKLKKGYKYRKVKDETGDLHADSYSIPNRQNYFCQLLDVNVR